VERARAAREQGASNTRAIRERACSGGRADGRLIDCLKSFIFVGHQFWASQSQRLSQIKVWASFVPKNILLGPSRTQIPKFRKDCFGIGCGGKHFLAQILKFGIWDLGQFFCAVVETL
jgi:hypothetical protein